MYLWSDKVRSCAEHCSVAFVFFLTGKTSKRKLGKADQS